MVLRVCGKESTSFCHSMAGKEKNELPENGIFARYFCDKNKIMSELKHKYENLFNAVPNAPLAKFLDYILEDLPYEQKEKLIIEQVSYNRYSPNLESLEAFLCIAPVENNQWIWVRVDKNSHTKTISESFFIRSSYGNHSMGSLKECLDHYNKNTK